MTQSLIDIRLFVAVYEERSFTAAATREHATQSGVSHHIRKLEQELETQLFIRGSGMAVRATPAGHAFYRAALDVLKTYDRAMGSIHGFGGALHGELKVGLIPMITRSILAPAFAEFVTVHPNLQIDVVEDLSHGLLKKVREGELEFALGVVNAPAAGVRCKPFSTWPCFLVSGKKADIAPLTPVRLADLPPLRLAAARSPNAVRAAIDAYIARHGAQVERWLELDSIPATLGIVAQTDWKTILPGPGLLPILAGQLLTINPIVEPPLFLDIALIEGARHARSAAADAFIESLTKQDRLAMASVKRTWMRRVKNQET